MSDYPNVEQKLATARTRLILDKPFLGALVLRLPMIPGDPKWCESTFSDGKTFYYNPDYIDALNFQPCDDRRCFFPRSASVVIPVKIVH